ncbi:hypothetical protein PCE1_004841 [Barthelona sp. PCE]
MDVEEMQKLYAWVDEIPLSRKKKHIAKDFSDAVLMAEICNHLFPRVVDLHNYSAAHSVSQKLYNWATLTTKVFKRLNFVIDQRIVDDAAKSVPGAIEAILFQFRNHIMSESFTMPGSNPPTSRKRRTRTPRQNITAADSPISSYKPHIREREQFDESQHMEPEREVIHVNNVSDEDFEKALIKIEDLEEKNQLMQLKIRKLEQLVRLKDSRIQALTSKLHTTVGQ